MFARTAALLSLIGMATANIDAQSIFGKELMKSSRRLNNNNERDVSWMPNYSIKFQKCHSLVQVAGEEGNGGDGEGGMLYTQHLVEFALCPTDSCTTGSGCSNGATYIANMREFTELYLQYKQELKEQKCETIRENCYNDDDYSCFTNAEATECIEVEGGEEEDMERYMECEMLENDGNNNNYNYNDNANYYREYFVGPYCSSNGKSIHLGVFLDEGCSVPAEDGVYESMNYGKSLPYTSSSMIEMDCISCEEYDEDGNDNNNNNNNNGNGNDDGEIRVIEMCEEMYEMSGRCEKNLAIDYPDTTACDFISTVLPKLEGISKSLGVYTGPNTAAVVCAWVFGILAIALGIYSFLLYRRLRRSKVALNQSVGNMA